MKAIENLTIEEQRLYEIIARNESGEVVHHWITTSCIVAMTQAHTWFEAYRIGLYSSVNHCNDMPEIVTIK